MRPMNVAGTLLEGFLLLVVRVLDIYWWIVLVAVVITWVNPSPHNPIVQFLNALTQPVFSWVRRKVPGMTRVTFATGFDLSPIVVFLAISLVQFYIVRLLVPYARALAGA
jgi:YggT family protein